MRNLRGRRKDKGTKRRKTDVSDAEVPSDPESVDDEALSDNLSTQVCHHHQVPVSVPVPLPMEAPVQASLILTDKKDHFHLARDGECPALL